MHNYAFILIEHRNKSLQLHIHRVSIIVYTITKRPDYSARTIRNIAPNDS